MNLNPLMWFRKEEELKYPRDFAIIDFSPIGLKSGAMDSRNKIIYRYFINEFGNIVVKKYRYSEERVHALRMVHKIPVYDKTKKEIRFPVFARILPGEARFIQSR